MISRCKKCRNKFTYKEVLKSIYFNGRVRCKTCNEENKIELIRKFLLGGAIILPLFIRIFRNEFKISNISFCIIEILYLILVILISPFFMKCE